MTGPVPEEDPRPRDVVAQDPPNGDAERSGADGEAGVDGKRDAGDVAAGVGDQP
jgi:hypothetical protein